MDIYIKDYKAIFINAKYLWITKPWKIQQPTKSKSSNRPISFPFLLKGKFFSCVTRHSVVTSFKLKRICRDFPDGLAAMTPCSQCREPGFNPWLGNYIPHVAPKTHCSQINKKLLFKKNIHISGICIVVQILSEAETPKQVDFTCREYDKISGNGDF